MSTCSKHIPCLVGHPLSNWTNHLRYYPTSILVRTNHDSAMRRTFDFDRVSSLSSRSATLISQHLGNLVVRKQTGVTSSSRSQVGGGGGREGMNPSANIASILSFCIFSLSYAFRLNIYTDCCVSTCTDDQVYR